MTLAAAKCDESRPRRTRKPTRRALLYRFDDGAE
jgi:hypothetical protein